MNSANFIWLLTSVPVIAAGVMLVVFPKQCVQFLARLNLKQFRDWYRMSDEEINSIPRPFNRILGTGQSYTQDLQTAIEHPEQARTAITCLILFGAMLILLGGGPVLVVIVLRLAGLI
jgi:hypothetical protein